jgi:ADP-ribosyl-[dinitrogen reductase] hydrolase
MKPTHERNVRGMHAAPRCEARTKAGGLCLSPAVQNKTRCHVHGGKGSKAKSHAQRLGDYSKAGITRDRQVGATIKEVEKLIREAAMGGSAMEQRGRLEGVRRRLLDLNQQSEARLSAAYVPSVADREAARLTSKRLAHAYRYDKMGAQTMARIRDRALGSIIGLAVGEAVGISQEGKSRDRCGGYVDMGGGGHFGLERGQWAGDTAMALALLQSLSFRGKLDETDFMDRLAEWETEGKYSCTKTPVGMGEVTREALAEYRRLGNPVAGDPNPDCLDSGSLVRVGVVAARYWKKRAQLDKVAARQSETTHASLYVVDSCIAFADILADAIAGQSREVVLRDQRTKGASSAEFLARGSWKHLRRDDVRSTNNALGLLEAALWCVHHSDNFAEAVLRAAKLGHDTGTVAALTGQLAGALYGASAIPENWTEDLAWYYQILDWAETLVERGLEE